MLKNVNKNINGNLHFYTRHQYLRYHPLQPYYRWITKLPKHYWETQSNQREFLDKLFDKLHLHSPEDWYSVTRNDIKENGGSGLLNKHGSIANALRANYPEIEWNTLHQNTLPRHFWESKDNHYLFIDNLIEKLKLRSKLELKNVPKSQILEFGGQKFLNNYKNDFQYALTSLFPNENWSFECTECGSSAQASLGVSVNRLPAIESIPKRDQTTSKVLQFLDQFYTNHDFSSLDCWYSVDRSDILNAGGSFIYKKYNNSLCDVLQNEYPNYCWNENYFQFQERPKKFWSDHNNQRLFLESLFKLKNLKTHEDWYKITKKDIKDSGGHQLLRLYGEIVRDMLSSLYPTHSWDFLHCKRKNVHNLPYHPIRNAIHQIIALYSIREKEDWYRTSLRVVANRYHLFYEANAFIQSLNTVYPNEDWKIELFTSRNKKSEQRMLFSTLSRILERYEIVEDYKCSYRSSQTKFPIEIDIFIPNLGIAFEYHGPQHYDDIPRAFNSLELNQIRDNSKKEIWSNVGILFIEVPHYSNIITDADYLKMMIRKKVDSFV